MRRGLSRLVLLAILLHLYVAVRLLPDLALGFVPTLVLALYWAASAVLTPLGVLVRATRWRHKETIAWLGLLAMGLYSSLFVLTVMRDVFLAVASLVQHWDQVALPLAAWRHDSAVAVCLIALGLSAIGFINARSRARVVAVDVPITGLPDTLAGFRIVQISDIHVGPTIKRPYLEAIVAAVNDLNPDVVAITGDLVDGSVAELAVHTAPLAELKARHGVFFVTGNHEYYSGAPAWIEELRRLGLTVLLNEHVVLEHGGGQVVVAGVTDFGAHQFDPSHASDAAAAIAGAPAAAAVRVLLAHQPRSAPAAERAGFDLQLSGHTHGGQFFPWNFFVKLQQPFVAGLNRIGGLWVYTSRGTGYWGPPKRVLAPSEITELRLVAA